VNGYRHHLGARHPDTRKVMNTLTQMTIDRNLHDEHKITVRERACAIRAKDKIRRLLVGFGPLQLAFLRAKRQAACFRLALDSRLIPVQSMPVVNRPMTESNARELFPGDGLAWPGDDMDSRAARASTL
jgi:hypothetical protein